MEYIITEHQKGKIIAALRFAADTGNTKAAKDWNKLADYLEVLEPEKPQTPPSLTSSSESGNPQSVLSA
jgi:deferrochelatase/peroxidase EfeB